MESRMDKYYTEKPIYNRTSRNAKLYKEVYGNYTGLENLPIADNTNEIDIHDLKEIVKENDIKSAENNNNDYFKEKQAVRNDEEQRIYDINKILEKVKSENSRRNQPIKKEISPSHKFLSTLESDELKILDVKKAYNESYTNKEESLPSKLPNLNLINDELKEDEKIYMTRELKFHDKQLEIANDIDNQNQEELSPLDLFQDLKPDGNTFITEPIKQEKDNILTTTQDNEVIVNKIENNNQNDDIDIIKKSSTNNNNDNYDDFYTSSYKFSKKDFVGDDDDDFFDEPKKGHSILRGLALIVAIFALTIIIYYFINKFGIGI